MMSPYKAALVRNSLSRQVYQHLKQAIILQETPEFKMGQRLNEAAIAKMFNCSVTPVRESINMLRRDGLIVGNSYQSSSVVSFTIHDVENIFHVRRYLEVGGLEQAFDQLTVTDIEMLRQSLERYRLAYESFDETGIIEHNRSFHNIILQRANNELLCRMLASITDQVAMVRAPIAKERKEWGTHTELLLPVREHEAVLQAIEAKNLEAAKQALIVHLNRICRDSCHHYAMAGWEESR